MDKSGRGTIQFIWSHEHYDACRGEPGFAGFRDEYTTGYANTGEPQTGKNPEDRPVTFDMAPVSAYQEPITKRPKLMNRFTHDDITPPEGEPRRFIGTGSRYLSVAGDEVVTLAQNADTSYVLENTALKLTSEISFPNYQRQEVPGMRGAQLTLKKIELQFSKNNHNVEFIDVDLNNLIGRGAESLSSHLHNSATANVIRVFSDGQSRREEHLYNSYIGEAQDALPEIGIRSVAYWPRLGMPAFGMASGNDVHIAGGGVEDLKHIRTDPQQDGNAPDFGPHVRYRHANNGSTNGVLLRANIIVERLST